VVETAWSRVFGGGKGSYRFWEGDLMSLFWFAIPIPFHNLIEVWIIRPPLL